MPWIASWPIWLVWHARLFRHSTPSCHRGRAAWDCQVPHRAWLRREHRMEASPSPAREGAAHPPTLSAPSHHGRHGTPNGVGPGHARNGSISRLPRVPTSHCIQVPAICSIPWSQYLGHPAEALPGDPVPPLQLDHVQGLLPLRGPGGH